MRLDLRGTWLAVMSACETGLTDYRDFMDEYQGLPAAFLAAGAQTVVASLWAVSDASTSLLMQRFHSNLYQRKTAKASALREAQRWLRDLPELEAQALLKAKQAELMSRMSAANAGDAYRLVRDLAKASGGRPFANPYWWAAFRCIGAGWPTTCPAVEPATKTGVVQARRAPRAVSLWRKLWRLVNPSS